METGDYQEQGYEFLIGMNQQVTSWQKVCKIPVGLLKLMKTFIHTMTHNDRSIVCL